MNLVLRNRQILVLIALLLTAHVVRAADRASGKPGLLLIAHGSPSADWNQPVLELGAGVTRRIAETGQFSEVRTAMMEFSEPNIPTAVAELEAAGCSRIVAVPLFVMPTGHTHFDVPAVLGLYSSAETIEHAGEHGGVARCSIPITLTETMSADDRLLPEYALREVQKMSKSPSGEAIVFLAHGAPSHALLCDRVMRRIAGYCCGKTGVEYADWAYVGVGQRFKSEGLSAVRRAAESKDRVLVVGLYLASHAQRIRDRAMGTDSHSEGHDAPNASGREVLFSGEGIVASSLVADWVIDTACQAAETFQE